MAKKLMNPQASTVYPVTEEWLCDSEEEVETLPESTPAGSVVIYKDENGRGRGKMKFPDSEWADV